MYLGRSAHQVERGSRLAGLATKNLVQTVDVPSHEKNSNSKDPCKDLGSGSCGQPIQGSVQPGDGLVDKFTRRVVLVLGLDILLAFGRLFVQLFASLRNGNIVVSVVVIIVVVCGIQAGDAVCIAEQAVGLVRRYRAHQRCFHSFDVPVSTRGSLGREYP